MQFDVGLAANNAGGRAGRVEQYAVERRAIPPFRWFGGIACDEFGAQAESVEVAAYAGQARSVDIERGDVCLRTFEQVCGLSARCRAGIENAFAILRIGQDR